MVYLVHLGEGTICSAWLRTLFGYRLRIYVSVRAGGRLEGSKA